MLLVASVSLPRVWQDRPFRVRSRLRVIWPARRIPLGAADPIEWLAGRNRSMRSWTWATAIAGAGFVTLVGLLDMGPVTAVTENSAAWVFGLLLKILIAIQASRFFAEARRTGAMELLLCTPLASRDLIRG